MGVFGNVLGNNLTHHLTVTNPIIASSITLSPGTIVNESSVAGGVAWTNIDNVKVDDNNFAEAVLSNKVSQYLKVTNFGFSIPIIATINGIKVEIKRSYVGNDPLNPTDFRLNIVKSNGTRGLINKSIASEPWSENDSYVIRGSNVDKWGETWTASDINSTNFGFAISVGTEGPFGTCTARINHIRITVYFS